LGVADAWSGDSTGERFVMGSWARSLHIEHADSAAVVNAVRMILVGEGQREVAVERSILASQSSGSSPRDKDRDDDCDDAPPIDDARRLCVFQPRNGWVGILDDGEMHDLASLLSARLHAKVLVVLVNDSDAWLYQLYRDGLSVDAYDSSGGGGADDDEMPPELLDAMKRGDEREIERLFRLQVDGVPIPPRGVWEHIRRFCAQLTAWLRRTLGKEDDESFEFGFDLPRAAPLDGESLALHLGHLRDFFPAADARGLRELLPLNRFPAEALLLEFLLDLGLPEFYAHLSYDYLAEHTLEELARHEIVPVAELRFERRA
jgi:hypothetical protein